MRASLSVRVFTPLCVVVVVLGGVQTAQAQAPLLDGLGGIVDYGSQCLSPNDDGSGPAIDLTPAFPSGLHYFGTTHTTAYVNTNGHITFGARISMFSSTPFPFAAEPMIAPFLADVDIRYTGGICQGNAGVTCTVCTPCHHPSENGVWWNLEPGRMVVTWHDVGYYNCNMNWRNSFQIVITEAGCPGSGDFNVEFRYNRCEWETGDASGGVNGFGGTEAQAGFDAGNQSDYVSILGSGASGIANGLCTGSNVGVNGVWQFQLRNGVVRCPDAGQPCDTGQLGLCANGHTACVDSGTVCQPDVQPSPEVCDATDNDCDGVVDETDEGTLCVGSQECLGGYCADHCLQSICGTGLVCDPSSGLCVEPGCVGITCDPGERCSGGACVHACAGVICPFGEECRTGICVDACDGLTCDTCELCDDGVCAPDCNIVSCPAGETCDASGFCVDSACNGVTCPAGFHCDNGTCVDNCDGVACPAGRQCELGECVQIPPEPDAAVVLPDASVDAEALPPDAAHQADAGIQPDAASQTDAVVGDDAGDDPPPSTNSSGCSCRTGNGDNGDNDGWPTGALGLMVLVALLALRRRRWHS